MKSKKYHINAIKNNFNVSAIINFNNGEATEEEMLKAEKGITQKFTGAENSARFMLAFNASKVNATTVERLESDNLDQKFIQLSKDTIQNIYAAHRITSPSLFGIKNEGTGFSKTEYAEAFDIFNKTVILQIQQTLESQFDKLFNIENSVRFIKYNQIEINK